MTPPTAAPPDPIRWSDDGRALVVLDQTELPAREVERTLSTVDEIEEAIRSLRVRGAPLIGITAAMGVAALARRHVAGGAHGAARDDDAAGDGGANGSARDPAVGSPTTTRPADAVRCWCDRLAGARPTAVNLAWALGRMRRVAERADAAALGPAALVDALVREADAIREEDRAMCRRMGEHALPLLRDATRLLTHCNAGALATGGLGTALAPIYLAAESGTAPRVFVGETRPLLQGSRLTAWELGRAGVDVTVMSDGAAGALFATEPPDAVVVGADRIAANGDVANKIGTYVLAVLARHHGVPFLVLAPTSTVDLATATGADIPIEHRSADELTGGFGRPTAPEGARVLSPAFDVTPADLVTAIVTEAGVHRPPFAPALRVAVASAAGEGATTGVALEEGADREPAVAAGAGDGASPGAAAAIAGWADAVADARRALVDAGRLLHDRGLLAGTAGNLSARLTDGRIVVTPRGVRKDRLEPGDLVVIDPASPDPSALSAATSEWPLHRACHSARGRPGALVHAHAPALTALGLEGDGAARLSEALPELGDAVGPVADVPFGPSGSEELAAAAAAALADGARVLLLARHGALAWGPDVPTAVDGLELAELSAKAVLMRR